MPRDLASDPSGPYSTTSASSRRRATWGAGRTSSPASSATSSIDSAATRCARWAFEVWNEPNLRVFWSADEAAYFDLYDASVRAVRSVDPTLRVGGPATAAVGWVDDLLGPCRGGRRAARLPLDPHLRRCRRSTCARSPRGSADPTSPLWWTEWGVSPTHGSPINDSVWAAPLVARGMRSAAGRLESLAYWVASDHFVELGEPERLFHGGFGLLTIGNLRKPRFWAIRVLELLGERELRTTMRRRWGRRARRGVGIEGPRRPRRDRALERDDRSVEGGWRPLLDRTIQLTVDGLAPGGIRIRHRRVDASHSNIAAHWDSGGDWPDESAWERLRVADSSTSSSPSMACPSATRRLRLEFSLPMPSVSLVELLPTG